MKYTVSNLSGIFDTFDEAHSAWTSNGSLCDVDGSVWITTIGGPDSYGVRETIDTVTIARGRNY